MARKAKQPKGKKMRPNFFIFCEGQTEAAYVDLLRRTFKIPMEIIVKISDSSKGIFSPAMKKNLIEGITEATNRAMAKTPYSNPSSTVIY